MSHFSYRVTDSTGQLIGLGNEINTNTSEGTATIVLYKNRLYVRSRLGGRVLSSRNYGQSTIIRKAND